MSDRWVYLRETELDLTPLFEGEELAAYCNGNYWLVSYDKHGIQVVWNQAHLTPEQSWASPIVTRRMFWCPHCMKSIPCDSPTASVRHIATDPIKGSRTFRQVLDTRPGYFEELYFKYPGAYSQYKGQALRWFKHQPKTIRENISVWACAPLSE